MAVQKSQFAVLEEDMLKIWKKEKTFQNSLDLRKGAKQFSFYDGPPFANGLPHYGHVVPSTIKDAMGRYKTMRGYYVPRVAGWDTHGLPVEYEVEKQLGISGKKQILKLGVDKFNQACRDSVFRYKGEFEDFISRLGRWIDLEHPYTTLDDSYIESVWWVLSELHKKDLVYRSFRSMPYCPRCATPLSNFELNQGYQDDVEDPSVYVTFPLKSDPDTALLAWTTTPWTLYANELLAVKPDATYATVELKNPVDINVKRLILAKNRLSELDLRKSEYRVVKTQKGQELVGQKYEPLYKVTTLSAKDLENAYQVLPESTVSLEDGTGVLHVAPRYGEVDLALGLKHRLPLISSVDNTGQMVPELNDVAGQFFKDADPHIIAHLTKEKRVFAAETIKHTYPFCWRCDSPLLHYATPSWFVKVTTFTDKLVKNNEQINWVPKHIKAGRFGNWLADARDWGISRNRFWGAPLPIWVNQEDDTDIIVVSSLEELSKLSGQDKFDLHRPGIDMVIIKKDGKTYKRVEEVLDCWFESGSMPYGQGHYPFENKEEFNTGFPADFISEGLDQTRGWFYTLHVLATGLFDKPAYKNVVCHGIVLAADGKKLSKRLRNYPPLEEVFNTYGADILRFFMLNSPVVVGEHVRFSADHLRDTQRNVFMTLQNSFGLFQTYTGVDKWQPESFELPNATHVLDRWILARLQKTISEVTKQADAYRLDKATDPLVSFVDDLSNWYVRRSRRRFWKSENDSDKLEAYTTLHYVLVRLTQLFAPWSPFISDHLWRELTKGLNLPQSVHLSDWPKEEEVDNHVIEQMELARNYINEGLGQRPSAGIKARQPLASLEIPRLDKELQAVIAEEVNVKEVVAAKGSKVVLDIRLTEDLKAEGLMRDLVRQIQEARKKAGLEVSDRIHLDVKSDDKTVQKALDVFTDVIKLETLAVSLNEAHKPSSHESLAKVEVKEVVIGLAKA